MFSSQFDYNFNSEESEEVFENDLQEKYSLLQNNHRRLLGVATILTEALENTVKGSQFNMENTLNKCMEIYPELFMLRQKKFFSKLSETQKIYTTPASDFTDIDLINTMSDQNKTRNSHYLNQESSQYFRNKPKSVSQKTTSNSIPPRITTAVGYVNSNYDEVFINEIDNNISDTTPYLILTPNKRNSISSQISDVENFKFTTLKKNTQFSKPKDHVDTEENEYDVKLPESDNEQFKKEIYTRRDSNESTSFIQNIEINKENVESNKTLFNKSVPIEITVQKSMPVSTVEHVSNEGDILIKIKPDTTENNFMENTHAVSTLETHTSQNFLSTPRKTIISSPLETCIIITNHVNTSIQKINENVFDEKNTRDSLQDTTNKNYIINVTTNEENIIKGNQSHLITDKLQKLSTGLKARANVMQIPPSQTITELKNETNKNQDLFKDFENNLMHNQINKRENQQLISTTDLDKKYFEKLKHDLTSCSVNECASIIQSLRLKLIHTLAKERADLISSYINNDILNLNKDVTMLEFLLPKEIINGWDLILQQITLKFLNTLCSIWKGRDYLSSNVKVIMSLITHFFEKHKTRISQDSLSQDMLIAIFHKLSTRPNQQAILLHTGLLEKIFYSISEGYGLMSTYKIKHSLGILINLCVNSGGRNILEPMCSEMLQFLISLLKKRDKKILPYIARLIYVLMADEFFHKKAKEINLHKSLEEYIDSSNKRLKLQLDILTSVIDQPNPHQYLNGTEENFLANIEAEMDELEEEVEFGEPFLQNNNMVKNGIEESPIKAKNSSNKQTKHPTIPIQRNVKKKSIFLNKNKKTTEENNAKIVKQKSSQKSFIKIKNQNDGNKNNTKTKCNDMVKQKNDQSYSKNRLKTNRDFHEIIESFEENPTSYVILEDSINCSENLNITQSVFDKKHQSENDKKGDETSDSLENNKSLKNINCTETNEQVKAESKSFVLLSENESNKSTSPEFNLGLSSESNDSVEIVNLAIEEPNSDVNNKIVDNSPSQNNYLMVHSSGSPKVSLFIQHGKITAIDYDYCEDTKEIQSPIEHGNIFKLNRQSPYKNLLSEGKSFSKMQPTVISKHKRVSVNNTNNKTKDPNNSSQAPFTSSSETQI